MKKLLLIAAILAAVAGYYYWQHIQPKPTVAHTEAPPPPPPPPPPKTPVRQVLETPADEVPLPHLDESDSFVVDALAGLIGNKTLMGLFRTEQLIRNIVATIDNLPGQRAPMRLMPTEPASGKFLTAGSGDKLSISPKNAARYAPYLAIVEAIDAGKLVALYIRLYPLLQKAYEELGYPNGYFNDRLMVVLDNLLATPDIVAPPRLIRPKYYYLFADPDLEARSIGQRILIRTGGGNEAVIKNKLKEIKQELLQHMHENKVVAASSTSITFFALHSEM